jgi:hypothetical protein
MRTYDWNGHTDIEIRGVHLSDKEVAGMVRMLMRNDLNHEMVCTLGRDRIMCLLKEKAELKRENDRLNTKIQELEHSNEEE